MGWWGQGWGIYYISHHLYPDSESHSLMRNGTSIPAYLLRPVLEDIHMYPTLHYTIFLYESRCCKKVGHICVWAIQIEASIE